MKLSFYFNYRIILSALLLSFTYNSQAGAVTLKPGQSIQAAIDAAKPGEIIHLEAGDYYVSKPLTINKDNLTIRGSYRKPTSWLDLITHLQINRRLLSIVRKTDSRKAAFIVTGNNVTIDSIQIDGGVNHWVEPPAHGVGIVVEKANNIHVINSRVRNNSSHGIQLGNCSNATIKDNYVHYNVRIGISQFNVSGSLISGNDVESNGGEGVTVDCGTSGSTVEDNWIYNNAVRGLACGSIGIDAASHIVIRNNVIDYNRATGTAFPGSGITFNNQPTPYPLCNGDTVDVTIHNNSITRQRGYGILEKACVGADSSQYVEYDNQFSGNLMGNKSRYTLRPCW